jgi:hypothetical protein
MLLYFHSFMKREDWGLVQVWPMCSCIVLALTKQLTHAAVMESCRLTRMLQPDRSLKNLMRRASQQVCCVSGCIVWSTTGSLLALLESLDWERRLVFFVHYHLCSRCCVQPRECCVRLCCHSSLSTSLSSVCSWSFAYDIAFQLRYALFCTMCSALECRYCSGWTGRHPSRKVGRKASPPHIPSDNAVQSLVNQH